MCSHRAFFASCLLLPRNRFVDETTCTIDGLGPLPVTRPASVAELGDVVRRAAAAGQAIYPLGGRTMLDVGLPPSEPGIAIDLRGFAGVIDYPARDMTITVQAGITLAELQRLLSGEGQRLPIDVPRPEQATLGGALATNTSGARRLGAGTLRDYVIGISTINDQGQETKAGGRVVKNVAGYDLCKLHIGALGTLGIITQVTLKVRPRPETQALLTFGCTAGELEALLDQLHTSRTRPICLDLLNAPAAKAVAETAGLNLPDRPWVLVAGFEDSESAVNWQLQQLIKELTGAGHVGVMARAGAATEPLWQALADFLAPAEARLTMKANLLPGRTAAWCLRADALPAVLHIHAQAGSGIVRAHAVTDLTPADAAAMLKELTAEATAASGNVVLPRCPTAWKRNLSVWGAPRNDLALMCQVKNQLDPRGLFNPGRFVTDS
jgi:glycolate oxidase FAD binding subunit